MDQIMTETPSLPSGRLPLSRSIQSEIMRRRRERQSGIMTRSRTSQLQLTTPDYRHYRAHPAHKRSQTRRRGRRRRHSQTQNRIQSETQVRSQEQATHPTCEHIEDFKKFFVSTNFPFTKHVTETTLCTVTESRGNIITKYVFIRMAYLYNLLKTGRIVNQQNELFLKIVKYANNLSNAINELFNKLNINEINSLLFYECIYYFFNIVEKMLETIFERDPSYEPYSDRERMFNQEVGKYIEYLSGKNIFVNVSDNQRDNILKLNEIYTDYSLYLPVQEI
jgi:hypothetical protein